MTVIKQAPFFSVVIPTRGRSQVIGYAIQSLLGQSFEDWEIVIADNDYDDATHRAVSDFRDDRIRYFRTGDLAMNDNWEAGLGRARGEFVLPLADKQALKPGALEEIKAFVEREQPACMRWLCDTLDDTGSISFVARAGGSGQVRTLESTDLLERLTTGRLNDVGRFLPLGHLSGFSRSLLERVKAGASGRYCPPTSPDYTLAYHALAFGESVLHVDVALAAASLSASTGRSALLKSEVSQRAVQDSGGAAKFFDRVPVKALLVRNSVYNDYLRMRETVQGKLTDFPLRGAGYFLDCYEDIRTSEKLGVDMSQEMEAWRVVVQDLSADLRDEVLAQSEDLPELRRKGLGLSLKSLRRKTGLTRLEWAIKNRVYALTGRKDVGRFANVLEYVQSERR